MEADLNLSAIPTEYAGIRFRSRLEAKWAAFFDMCDWRWDYEPIDLAGYIPDFILQFGRPLLVEIKPLLDFDESEQLARAKEKAEATGWPGEILILGTVVHPRFGLIRDADAGWTQAIPFRCDDCGSYSILADDGSWRCRVYGCDIGVRVRYADPWDVTVDFRRASTQVQWKAA